MSHLELGKLCLAWRGDVSSAMEATGRRAWFYGVSWGWLAIGVWVIRKEEPKPYDVKTELCLCQHDKSWHWGDDADGECLFALASPEECPCNRLKPTSGARVGTPDREGGET